MGLLSSSGLSSTPDSATVTTPTQELQPYVNTVLSKGDALLKGATPAYTGQMTAGDSDYQKEAWQGLSNLTLPSNMTTAGSELGKISTAAQGVKFDPSQINQYMNPFLMNALNPQLDEMRRQAQINMQPRLAALARAGAYGGGRQAIMESEAMRNLLTEQNKTVGQGYKDAYDSAMKAAQYASDLGLKGLQQATTASQAQGNVGANEAQYGLANLQALSTAGKTQQENEQAALNAQYNEWLRQQNYLPNALKAQTDLIRSLPGGTNQSVYKAKPSALQTAVGSTAGVASVIKNLKDAGLTEAAIKSALSSMGVNPDTMQQQATEITNAAQPGQEGYGWRYFSDGTVIDPSGAYYKDGKLIWSPANDSDGTGGGGAADDSDSTGGNDYVGDTAITDDIKDNQYLSTDDMSSVP